MAYSLNSSVLRSRQSSKIKKNIKSTDKTEEKNLIHKIDAKTIDYLVKKNVCRIDTHHHIVPEFYFNAVEESGGDPSGWSTPKWSIEQAQEHMSLLGIQTAIVSITAPSTKIYENNKEKGRIIERKLNEFSFDLVKNNPKQFGFFGSLPSLIDIEGTINVHSILKPNGFTLFTSYGDGQYIGHSSFKTIWEKLNKLKTVVFIHPTESLTTIVNQYFPKPLIDYPQETILTASDIVLTGIRL